MSIDDGDTLIALGAEGGRVVLTFPRSLTFVALDPENARQLAEGMARAAHEIFTGRKFNGGGSAVGSQIRDRLALRVEHILRSLEGKPRGYIAKTVVEVILSEVL